MKIYLQRHTYAINGALCIETYEAETGFPFARLTVNNDLSRGAVRILLKPDKGFAFIDTNNCPWAESFLTDNKIGTPTGYIWEVGFCKYPEYRINLDMIEGKVYEWKE